MIIRELLKNRINIYFLYYFFIIFISALSIWAFNNSAAVFATSIGLTYFFLALRYIICLIFTSRYLKTTFPDIYKKNTAFSKFKGVRMINPYIVFNKKIYNLIEKNSDKMKCHQELKIILISMPSIIGMIVLFSIIFTLLK